MWFYVEVPPEAGPIRGQVRWFVSLLSQKTECEFAPLWWRNSLLSLNPRFVTEPTLGVSLALVIAMCYTAHEVGRDASCVSRHSIHTLPAPSFHLLVSG